MIIGVRPRDPDPVFRFIGEGHRWLASDYQVNGIGEHVENQPDKEYGAWVSEFYKSVASTGQPRYDLVSATIRTEKEMLAEVNRVGTTLVRMMERSAR